MKDFLSCGDIGRRMTKLLSPMSQGSLDTCVFIDWVTVVVQEAEHPRQQDSHAEHLDQEITRNGWIEILNVPHLTNLRNTYKTPTEHPQLQST